MPIIAMVVLWEKDIEGAKYRVIKEVGSANDAVNYTGRLAMETWIKRPDGSGFWHSIGGEAILPNDNSELNAMYGSYAEVIANHPGFLVPEALNTKKDVDAFIESLRSHQVDRFLDRASQTVGKYWNPQRAAESRAELLAYKDALAELIKKVQGLLDKYNF